VSADTTIFAGRPLVVKIGGAALEKQRASPALWRALLDKHTTHAGGVVLVHGGGRMVDALLDRLGMPTERREGLRITPQDQMDVIAGVLAGTVNKQLVGTINAAGGGRRAAVGLCLGDAGVVRVEKLTRRDFDIGCVGVVCEAGAGDGELLRELLRREYLPVVACVGIDEMGGLLNVNGDDAAAGIAATLRASALVLMTDVAGVKGADGSVMEELDSRGAEELIASGVVSGGMIPKVRSALGASRRVGSPVYILPGDVESFESWLRGGRVGTKVVQHAGTGMERG
jgi:acetylglutamate kinase